jgi:urea transport system substrate-binding protein
MQRRFALKLTTAALAASGLLSLSAHAQETIKVGVLHSLSGTMAISESVLKDTVLMMIADQNAKRWWSTQPPTGLCSPRRPAS